MSKVRRKNSLFIVGSLNDINYMQFSKAYCETAASLIANVWGNGSFRAKPLSSHPQPSLRHIHTYTKHNLWKYYLYRYLYLWGRELLSTYNLHSTFHINLRPRAVSHMNQDKYLYLLVTYLFHENFHESNVSGPKHLLL